MSIAVDEYYKQARYVIVEMPKEERKALLELYRTDAFIGVPSGYAVGLGLLLLFAGDSPEPSINAREEALISLTAFTGGVKSQGR